MTTDEVKTAVKRHRPAAVIGGVVGLVVLAGWIGYVVAMTPSRPVISTAPAEEVVAYIANSRGFASLPDIEQKQFMERWEAHVKIEENKQELKQCFDQLSDNERKAFTEAIARQFKRSVMDDARRFSQLTTPAQKHDFVRRKLEEGRNQMSFIKEVASAFRPNLGGREEFNQWVLEHTTPKERALGESYIEALKRVDLQIQKEQR